MSGYISQRIAIPFPPSANRYWRKFNNRMVISKEAREFKKAVSLIFHRGNFFSLGNNLIELNIELYRPKKIGDLDNYLKVTIDSLNGLFFDDDKQIKKLTAERFDDKLSPRVEIVIAQFR